MFKALLFYSILNGGYYIYSEKEQIVNIIEPMLPILYFIVFWIIKLLVTEWVINVIFNFIKFLCKPPEPAKTPDNTPIDEIFLRQLIDLHRQDKERQQTRLKQTKLI